MGEPAEQRSALRSKPLRYALILAAAYGAVTVTWIIVSSSMAAGASASVEELKRIETMKGIAFVTVMTLLVLVTSFIALRRMEQDGQELLRRERALTAAEGRVTAGLVASSVAHDANNVLMVVLGEISELQKHRSAQADDEQTLRRLTDAIQRLMELHRRLVNASRVGISHGLLAVDLVALVRSSVEATRSHKHVRGCNLVADVRGEIVAHTNPLLLHQILTNLILNAGEATNGIGRIDVRIAPDGAEAVVEVHDDGPGCPPGRREGLFDALETTKTEGNGLGLLSVKACARALGGSVDVGESDLGGARFRLHHPLRPQV